MSALELALQKKLDELAAEKAAKQSKLRLIADRSISVSSITHKLSSFLKEKQTKDLWSLLSPPPTGPQSYDWHTYPCPEWVCKVSPLLYEMLEICPNTKLTSSKVVASLKSLVENRDLELHCTRSQDQKYKLDRLDFTLRVVLNFLRTLKSDKMQRSKCQKSLCANDWLKVQLCLDRVHLPAELLSASSRDSLEEEEDTPNRIIHVAQAEDEMALALVPVPDKKPVIPSSSSKLKPLPAVFLRLSAEVGVATTKTGQGSNTPATAKPSWMTQVLQKAASYEPKVTSTEKAQSVKKTKKADVFKKKKTKASKVQAAKTTKASGKSKKQEEKKKKEEQKRDKELTYKPGEMRLHEVQYIKELQSEWDMTPAEARQHWKQSLRRAKLLAPLSIAELVKRRFVAPGTTTNPFAAQVEKSLHAEDID
eukprot:Skav208969  [mRNA]  locus=scaffold1134:72994:74259:+ [translate_table: standard]